MKNKLWTFGDSFTAGILPDINHFVNYIEYIDYLGISKEEVPENWGYQLAKKLNFSYETFSMGGASNQEIFFNISKNSHKFKKGDIIIINWTYLSRFLWGLEKKDYIQWEMKEYTGSSVYGKFRRTSISEKGEEMLKYAEKNVYEKIGLNRSLECWFDELDNFENIIETLCKSIGVEVFFWGIELNYYKRKESELNKRKYICNDIIANYIDKNKNKFKKRPPGIFFIAMHSYGVTSIWNETDGNVNDMQHRGINGNNKQAELFYSYIKKTEYPEKTHEDILSWM